MDLPTIRNKWESGLNLVKSASKDGEFYSILKEKNRDSFQVNRYFSIANNWHVSIDAQKFDRKQITAWINSSDILF